MGIHRRGWRPDRRDEQGRVGSPDLDLVFAEAHNCTLTQRSSTLRLIFEVPGRPQDTLALNDGERLDSDNPLVKSGEEFEVSDERALEILAQNQPTIRPATAPKPRKTHAAQTRAKRTKQ